MDRLHNNIWAIALAYGLVSVAPLLAQNANEVVVKRKPVPVATIRDPKTIDFFLKEFFIPEAKVDSIDFIDVVGDGFNERDMVQVYPSKEVYNLSPSEAAMAVMRTWKPQGVRAVGQKNKHGEIVIESKYPAAKAMFAGLVRLIEQNYVGKKISLMFNYDGDLKTADLMVWGYQEQDLLTPKKPLEQFANDLVIYVRTDTVYVEKPIYDIIYIEHTATDTTVISGGEL